MASDVGTIGLTQSEADRLRLYLEKGGFLWVDDFWGTAAWEQWTRELAQGAAAGRVPDRGRAADRSDLHHAVQGDEDPADHEHPVLARRRRLDDASERGRRQPGGATSAAIRDKRDGRIMVAMTHNTDVADSWEREGEDPAYFYRFSPDGYALGINVLLYAMTHQGGSFRLKAEATVSGGLAGRT